VIRVFLAAFFVLAGVMHFTRTSFYVYIMPPSLPWPVELVWISGACEIAGGLGLLLPTTRVAAGWGLIALLVAVFPANIHMAVNNVVPPGVRIPRWLLWVRLPLQFVLMYLVWWGGTR
jgi:uncharacterized membrane protein